MIRVQTSICTSYTQPTLQDNVNHNMRKKNTNGTPFENDIQTGYKNKQIGGAMFKAQDQEELQKL